MKSSLRSDEICLQRVDFVYGKGHRKSGLQKAIETINSWLERLKRYNLDIHICGDRNSYSKTDHDATFMHMKEDHMKNGQLKAGYNVNVATVSEYIVGNYISADRTDTKTFIPFMKKLCQKYPVKRVNVDSGYESEENYHYVDGCEQLSLFVKPSNHEQKKKRKYQTDIGRRENMPYDEEKDTYAGQIDAIIVKDLSRLGRHQMQTALFIDYLRQCGMAVISVTEGLNTMNDGDDLIIGVRQLMNDYYARDIGNKIRHGYREKQKEGLVVKPPFGYWKDRNTGRIRLHPETSVTVQIIYGLYCEGLGQKEITRRLNAMQRKTPKQLHDERCGKADGKVYRWTYQSVKNVLVEESYTGLLVNHRTETHGRTVTPVPEGEQYRHENFFPVIIDREEWERVQALLKANAKPYRGNTASHRYAGMLTCGDCGSTFVPRIRCWNGNRRVEYLCKSYMHHGRKFCPSHRIRESELDARVRQYAEDLRNQWTAEQADLRRLHRLWEMKRPAINAHIADLYNEIQRLEQEIDDLLLEKIQSGG